MTARQRYLQRRAVAGGWRVEGVSETGWPLAVVIPACDEEDWLFSTLDSLAANPASERERCLVLVVVNQTAAAVASVTAANQRTLDRLRCAGGHPGLHLAWVDAASPGLELSGGPGPARRLGLDLALSMLTEDDKAALVSLDADTLVDVDYLPALVRHFAAPPAGGAVLAYAHQPAATPALQTAIDRYELYLRCHQLGLQLAGSPYAFATIGSAMACTARAYVRIGGMTRKPAGEDFYFLQALAKTDGVARVQGTCVRPSARISTRVAFGTGPAVQRLAEDPDTFPVSPLSAYRLLGQFLSLTEASTVLAGETLERRVRQLDPQLAEILRQERLASTWDALRENHRGEAQLLRAFHAWFDALKTLQLLRKLAEVEAFTPQPAYRVAVDLLEALGHVSAASEAGCLQQLRELQ